MDFDEEELIHQEIMREIAQELSASTPMVLKGGTALLLGHGLSRHSTDLDYDSAKPMRLDSRIKKAVERKGGTVRSFKVTKAGASTTRAMVGAPVPLGEDGHHESNGNGKRSRQTKEARHFANPLRL